MITATKQKARVWSERFQEPEAPNTIEREYTYHRRKGGPEDEWSRAIGPGKKRPPPQPGLQPNLGF